MAFDNKHHPMMKYIVLLGRILYSLLFIIASFGKFSQSTIDYATSEGVPLASLLVPLAGILAFLGGASILLGYKARYGAWLLVLFLLPVTIMMHKFWGIEDAAKASMQQAAFMKNMALLGAALLISYFGSGPLSLDKEKEDHVV